MEVFDVAEELMFVTKKAKLNFKHELARALRLASNSGNMYKNYATIALRLYASL